VIVRYPMIETRRIEMIAPTLVQGPTPGTLGEVEARLVRLLGAYEVLGDLVDAKLEAAIEVEEARAQAANESLVLAARLQGQTDAAAMLAPPPSALTSREAALAMLPLPADHVVDQSTARMDRGLYLQMARAGAFPSTKVGKRVLAKWADVQAALRPTVRAPVATSKKDLLRQQLGLELEEER